MLKKTGERSWFHIYKLLVKEMDYNILKKGNDDDASHDIAHLNHLVD